jgi:hypothetical protein
LYLFFPSHSKGTSFENLFWVIAITNQWCFHLHLHCVA